MADQGSTPEDVVKSEADNALRRDPESSSTISQTQKNGVAPEQANDFVLDGMVDTQDTSAKSAIHHGSATTRDPVLDESATVSDYGIAGQAPRTGANEEGASPLTTHSPALTPDTPLDPVSNQPQVAPPAPRAATPRG